MARAQKDSARASKGALSPPSDGALSASPAQLSSATRLKQAAEETAPGNSDIALALMATLQDDEDEREPEVPSRLSFASLIPELTRSTSLQPLADKLEPEERRDVYRVAGKLGTGGMATVYEAVKEGADGFRKRVALKRIHDHLAEDDRIIELLADEARLASLINHPNVCQVLDFGVDSSGYFMALEYLDGFTLREVFNVLEEHPERVKEPRHQRIVARIIAGLAEGLHAAHELQDEKGESLEVVHRDVSPHNLFVLRSGNVKVTDFGVARARNQSHHTAAGVLKGKLAYSSPEQLHRSQLDRQTDIFALGVVMWELLTAQRLFSAESESAIIVKICSDPVPDVRARQPGVAAGIAAIARRALAMDPAQRFKTGREMASAIERALAVQGDSVPVTDVSEWLFELMGAPREPQRPELDRLAAETVGVPESLPTARSRKSARQTLASSNSARTRAATPLPSLADDDEEPTTAAKSHAAAPTERSLLAAPMLDGAPSTSRAERSFGAPVASTRMAATSAVSPSPLSSRSLAVTAGAALALAMLCGGAWLGLKPANNSPTTPTETAAPPREAARAPLAPPPAPPAAAPPAAAASVAPIPPVTVSAPAADERVVTPNLHAKPAPVPAAPKASAAAPAPELAPMHRFGSVMVTASGGAADVVVDGRNFGPAPQRITLPAGVHTVALSIAGRGTSSVTPVQIDAGASSFISLSVPPARD